jgi:hypothetical protein
MHHYVGAHYLIQVLLQSIPQIYNIIQSTFYEGFYKRSSLSKGDASCAPFS